MYEPLVEPISAGRYVSSIPGSTSLARTICAVIGDALQGVAVDGRIGILAILLKLLVVNVAHRDVDNTGVCCKTASETDGLREILWVTAKWEATPGVYRFIC